jgi:predicted ester cyclase
VTVRALVGRFYDELWNERELEVAPEILHPEISFRGSLGSSVQGRSGVCDYVTMVTSALAGYRCDVEQLIVEHEGAAARVRFSGRHTGTFLGREPTGGRLEWTGAAFFTADDDLLRDVWVLGDLVSLYAQLDGTS